MSEKEKEKAAGESFDLDRLKQLIRLMEKHDLSEVKLQGGDQKWVLRRGVQGANAMGYAGFPMYPAGAMMPPHAANTPLAGSAETTQASSSAEEGMVEITSPTVGTFYSAPQPGDPAYVKIGDRVSPETIVCIVEAMKVFNQIPAEVSGRISKVLVHDGDAVEFGQALFLVNPG